MEQTDDNGSADVVVINTCTVTSQSDQKSRQILRRMRNRYPAAIIILTGCMVQAFPDKSHILDEADIIISPSDAEKIPEFISEFVINHQRIFHISSHERNEKFGDASISTFSEHTRAFLKIEDGCDRYCSYCIIPYARGHVRSKSIDNIRSELALISQSGYQEVVLTGINLSCYGKDIGLTLCDAVEEAEKSDIKRIRLGSLEPEMLDESVLKRLHSYNKLCEQFHISLQSGCNNTLKAMNRQYSASEYKTIVNNIRSIFSNPAVTTDVMVGFPGETESDFNESYNFVNDIHFSKVHVFIYSRRSGTVADMSDNQIDPHIKFLRSSKMIKMCKNNQVGFYASQIGRNEDVLFERNKGSNTYEGYTRNYTPVSIQSNDNLTGSIHKVIITGVDNMKCTCSLI
jgi:threonylcarbamoyladenosine tRNA methylthiotransferase MtaB